MKISLSLRETSTAGSVYSTPSMESAEQLVPSDEELAERDKEEAARQKEELEKKQKEAAKKQAEKKEQAPKTQAEEEGDDDDSGDDSDDSADDDSDSDSDDESEDGSDDDESDDEDSDSDDDDSDEDEDDEEVDDEDEEATASSLPFPDARGTKIGPEILAPRKEPTKASEKLKEIPADVNASDSAKKIVGAKEDEENADIEPEREDKGEELAIASASMPFPDCPIRPL